MIALNARQFNKFYWVSAGLVFLLVLLRCCMVPLAHDEVATFNFYIQPGNFIPFFSHVDAMGHFLSSATAWVFFKLFGSSALALRMPCLLSFVVLCAAVFKFNNLFGTVLPRLVLTFSFIFSYNFVAFFSLCRGYGISMAFLLMALYYWYCYARHFSFRHLVKFVFFSQLALSANLTLVFVLLITTAILVFLQIKNGIFISFRNIALLLIHLAVTSFWIKFAFFLQDSGALYYGSGDNYWQVTFQTLIDTVFLKSAVITFIILLLAALMLAVFVYRLIKEKAVFFFADFFSLSFVTLLGLALAFYLLKKLFNVNYPEDRTGLFFYVFFILALCFMINEFKRNLQYAFAVLPLFFAFYFVMHMNFRTHPWRIYETIPEEFFRAIVAEQQKQKEPVTIAGHRLREFIFGFLNYNSPVKLNHMTSPEALQMNCDYAVAYDIDKPYYEPYYNEMAVENDWGFRLLKRKHPLVREAVFSVDTPQVFRGNYEYYNAFEKLDTGFVSANPLQADFEFTVRKAPVPFNAWLVVQVDDREENGNNVFVRVPLNLIRYDWAGAAHFKTSLVTGNIPLKIKRVVCYLWNIDKQEIDITVNSFRLFRLKGEGVTEISKAKI